MKPEIQFLAELIAQHKLPAAIREKVTTRLGEVAENISVPQQVMVQARSNIHIPGAQAPSTQRILDEIAQNPSPAFAALQMNAQRLRPALPPVPDKIDKETNRPIVSTGKGTSGPKKW